MKHRPSAMPSLALPVNGAERAESGVIVTAREQTTDARVVLHCPGAGALAEICDALEARPGDWRVLTISTPASIYRDLQGTRASEEHDNTRTPEPGMLGRIGRLHLLDPSHGVTA